LLYSALTGVTFSLLAAVYSGESIANVFFITAGSFGALSFYGYTTKKDLTGMGRFMFMGLVGIILAMVINYFMASSILNTMISIIGVIVFAGLTAYDTQKLKDMYEVSLQGDEIATKSAILGALALYLDFINLFIMLLRLLGNRD
jgi:FtsH-binding integral membrane protein